MEQLEPVDEVGVEVLDENVASDVTGLGKWRDVRLIHVCENKGTIDLGSWTLSCAEGGLEGPGSERGKTGRLSQSRLNAVTLFERPMRGHMPATAFAPSASWTALDPRRNPINVPLVLPCSIPSRVFNKKFVNYPFAVSSFESCLRLLKQHPPLPTSV